MTGGCTLRHDCDCTEVSYIHWMNAGCLLIFLLICAVPFFYIIIVTTVRTFNDWFKKDIIFKGQETSTASFFDSFHLLPCEHQFFFFLCCDV